MKTSMRETQGPPNDVWILGILFGIFRSSDRGSAKKEVSSYSKANMGAGFVGLGNTVSWRFSLNKKQHNQICRIIRKIGELGIDQR